MNLKMTRTTWTYQLQEIQNISTNMIKISENFVDIASILRMSQKAFSFIGEDY